MSVTASQRVAELAAWAQELTGEPIRDIHRQPGGGRHGAWAVKGEDGGKWFLRADSDKPDPLEH